MSNPDLESERETSPALGTDAIIPVLACSLAGYYFVSTADLVWEAKATGILIGVVLIALCAVQFARFGLRIAAGGANLGFGDLTANNLFNRQRLALIVLAALFVAAIEWIGTTPGLFVLLICSMLVMGVRSVRTLVGVAFVTAAVVHLVLIYLLSSRLPQGLLINLLWPASGGA